MDIQKQAFTDQRQKKNSPENLEKNLQKTTLHNNL